MRQKPASIAICVYSKSGRSRRVAERLGAALDVAPFELTTKRYTWPVLDWLAAARDGMRGRAAPLTQVPDVPGDGLVVLIGPVWAGGCAAPLNTMIDGLAKGEQEVAALLTCGDPKEQAAPLDTIAERLGRPLTAKMVLSNAAQDTPEGLARVDAFADALAACGSAE
jgi:hypothetical protein